MSSDQFPVFATNRPSSNETVAAAINQLFRVNREELKQAPHAAIATAYINAPGFLLIADELEKMPRIRILLGSEPIPEVTVGPAAANREELTRTALDSHEEWLRAERDSLGFEPKSTTAAQKLVEWLEKADLAGDPVVEIRRYTQGFLHGKAYISEHPTHPAYLSGSSNLTYAGLTQNAELNVGDNNANGAVGRVIDWFDEHWEKSEPFDLAELYRPLWAEHSPWSVFLRMLLERYGANLDDEKAGPTKFQLTRFQADGVKRMQRLLGELGGVLVADEVGLGKTFLALEVIAVATEEQRQRVMVVAPAALKASVWDPAVEKYDLSRRVTVHSFEEVRNRMDPEHPAHLDFMAMAEDAALIVVDEAHNLRNAGTGRSGAVDKVILAGKNPKKVVLLTATPVNNSLIDLETLIRYFVRDDSRFASIGIPSIREYIREAQKTDPEALTPGHLFDLMDQVAVRRTRNFVKVNYQGETVPGPTGKPIPVDFPDATARRISYSVQNEGEQLVQSMIYALDIPEGESHLASFEVRRGDPGRLLLSRYTPSAYRLDSKLDATQVTNMGLLRSALLKRLESSPVALESTLRTLISAHESFVDGLDAGYVLTGGALREYASSESEDLDEIISNLDKDDEHQAISRDQFHFQQLRSDVLLDLELLESLRSLAINANSKSEPKSLKLFEELGVIASNAKRVSPLGISESDRRKVIVFSTYADTIRDLHLRLSDALESAEKDSPLAPYKGRLAEPIFGESRSGGQGGINQETRAKVIAEFAPRTAGRLNALGEPVYENKYDILLTTDVLAEGVNLQQAGQIINYDLPWNPMRIVQRHGRVDRIGSEHQEIHLGLFFPSSNLDDYLQLENTLIRKLKQADAAVGTGTVIPGVSAFGPQNHFDVDQVVQDIEDLVNSGGGSAAGSGEEYRRRLANELDADRQLRRRLELLPHNIGSGFVNKNQENNSFVFCMRMGNRGQVWFRNVFVDENWAPIAQNDGRWKVEDDTLKSLVAADPRIPIETRVLTTSAFQAAYRAWEIARDDAFIQWTKSTDPKNLRPDLPKSFTDASKFIQESADHLTPDLLQQTIKRLNSVPTAKAKNAMRAALNLESADIKAKVDLIIQVLDDFGIQPASKVEPLAQIFDSEIRLVAWMAVSGSQPNQPTI